MNKYSESESERTRRYAGRSNKIHRRSFICESCRHHITLVEDAVQLYWVMVHEYVCMYVCTYMHMSYNTYTYIMYMYVILSIDNVQECLPLCVYVYIHIHTYTHIHIHTCTYIYTYTYTYIYIHIHIYIYIHIWYRCPQCQHSSNMHMCAYTTFFKYAYVCIYIGISHVYTCTYAYTYVYNIHTWALYMYRCPRSHNIL